jgi:hypothetical protein
MSQLIQHTTMAQHEAIMARAAELGQDQEARGLPLLPPHRFSYLWRAAREQFPPPQMPMNTPMEARAAVVARARHDLAVVRLGIQLYTHYVKVEDAYKAAVHMRDVEYQFARDYTNAKARLRYAEKRQAAAAVVERAEAAAAEPQPIEALDDEPTEA